MVAVIGCIISTDIAIWVAKNPNQSLERRKVWILVNGGTGWTRTSITRLSRAALNP